MGNWNHWVAMVGIIFHLLIDFFEKSKLYKTVLFAPGHKLKGLALANPPPSHHLKIHCLSPATHAIFHALPRLLVWRPQARKTPQAPQQRQRQEGRPWQVEAPRGLGGTVEVTFMDKTRYNHAYKPPRTSITMDTAYV